MYGIWVISNPSYVTKRVEGEFLTVRMWLVLRCKSDIRNALAAFRTEAEAKPLLAELVAGGWSVVLRELPPSPAAPERPLETLRCPSGYESKTGHFRPGTFFNQDDCADCGLPKALHVPQAPPMDLSKEL